MSQEEDTTTFPFESAMAKILKSSQVEDGGKEIHDIKKLFQKYKSDPMARLNDDPLQYWKKLSESNIHVEKLLSDIAIQYLTPPPTSVDVERLFSVAGLIVSEKRNRLIPENAEKILFIRENLPKVNFQY